MISNVLYHTHPYRNSSVSTVDWLLKCYILTLFVALLDGIYLGIGAGAEDLDERALVCPSSPHGSTQGLGVVERWRLKQSQQTVLQVSAQF